MKKYKYSELEKTIQDVKKSNMDDKFWLYSQMIADITRDDNTATDLARKVLANDIENMLDKICSLYQRNDCNCKSTEGRSNIDILIEWLKYIDEDEF